MTDGKLVESLESAMNMSGLLFQKHPTVDGWDTTRAVSPEIACFVYRGAPAKAFVSVKKFCEGVTDDTYTYERDTYEVEVSPPDGGQERRAFGSRHDAAEYVASAMRQIQDNDYDTRGRVVN